MAPSATQPPTNDEDLVALLPQIPFALVLWCGVGASAGGCARGPLSFWQIGMYAHSAQFVDTVHIHMSLDSL